MMMLRNMMQEQQQRQALMPGQIQQQKQTLEAGALENQQRQQQINDMKTIQATAPNYVKKDADGKPNGFDYDGFAADVQAKGVSPATMAQLTTVRKNAADASLAQANAGKSTLEAQKDLTDQAFSHLEGIRGETDPDKRQSRWQAAVQWAGQNGVQGADKIPQQAPDDKGLSGLELTLGMHQQAIADAQKTADAQKAQAEAKLAQQKVDLNNPTDPDVQKAKYQGIIQKLQTKDPSLTMGEVNWAKSFEFSQRKTATQSDSLGVTSTNVSGPSGMSAAGGNPFAASGAGKGGGQPTAAGGASITPRPAGASSPQNLKDSIVDEIGQYKLNPAMLSRMMVKHPEIIAQVNQKYPDWSQPNYNAANKAVTDLAPSGKTGQQITSYNTFLRHAGALYDAVNSLDNSKYSDLINKPLNWLAQHTGDPRIADFMAAMQPPMKEFQSFLLNNHAMHDEDVKDAHNLIDQNKTPQEIRAVLNRFAETGSARLSEQNESFKRVTGRDIPNLVSPQAAAAYNKITGQGSTGAATKTYQGHTYTQQSDGSWKRQ